MMHITNSGLYMPKIEFKMLNKQNVDYASLLLNIIFYVRDIASVA